MSRLFGRGGTLHVGTPSSRPILSVVIPAFNASAHLRECLMSITQQSLRDLEVIVVDDGSADDTANQAHRIAQRDSRVRVLEQANAGPASARNRGIAESRGRFLTFVDADDLALPGAYSALVESLERTGSDLATGGYVRVGRSGRSRPSLVERLHDIDRCGIALAEKPDLLEAPVLWNKIFRRDFWEACVGELPDYANYEDQEPTYRALLAARSIDVLERDVYAWRLPENRETRSSGKGKRRDLRARLEVIANLEKLVEGAPLAVREVAYATWLGRDLTMHAEHVPSTRKRFWRVLRDGSASLAQRAPRGAWDRMPVQRRALAWALANGKRRDIEEILGTWAEETTTVPWSREAAHWLASPGYLDRLSFEVPHHIRELHPIDLVVSSGLRSAEWLNPDTILLRGYAFLGGFEPEQSRLRIRAMDGEEVLSEGVVRPAEDPHLDEEIADPWLRYARSGFEVRLRLPDCRPGRSVRFALQLTSEGHRAEAFLGGRRDLVAVGPCVPGLRRLARVCPRGRLEVVPIEAQSACEILEVRSLGRVVDLVVTGELSNMASLVLTSGTDQVAAARESLEPGITRFRVTIPPLPDRYERGGERFWQPALYTNRGLERLSCAQAVLDAAGDSCISASITPDGVVRLGQRWVRATAEAMAVEGRNLTIQGQIEPPPRGRLAVSMASATRRFEANQVQVDALGRFTAHFALEEPGGRRGRFPSGGYFLDFRRDVQSWSRLRSGGSLRKDPVRIESAWCDLRFEGRADQTVAVKVSPPLGHEARARVAQFDLRRERWGELERAITFETFNGKNCGDNPLAVFETVRQLSPDLPCFWSVRDATVDVPPGAIPVIMGTPAWHRALATSRVWVNNNNFPFYIRKRPGQYYLQTWHGTPIKQLLWDVPNKRIPLTYRRLMQQQVRTWDLLLAQSKTAEALLRSGLGFEGAVRVMEQPRNVRLGEPGLRTATRQRLGIDENEPAILYAPTWRDAHRNTEGAAYSGVLAPEDLALQSGGRVMFRSHHVTNAAPEPSPAVIDVSREPRIEDLMSAADALVTDYSSAAHDFALTGRPVVHFVPDLEEYRKERGFYDDWPATSRWPVLRAQDDLFEATRAALAVPTDDGTSTWWERARVDLEHLARELIARASSPTDIQPMNENLEAIA